MEKKKKGGDGNTLQGTLRKLALGCAVDSTDSKLGPMAASYERGNKASGFIEGRGFRPADRLFNNGTTSWSNYHLTVYEYVEV
jgi:hypothetical protein